MTALLQIVGYVWLAGMTMMIVLAWLIGIARTDGWTFVVVGAVLAPGVVMLGLAWRLERRARERGD